METRFPSSSARMVAFVGAGAWLVLAVAWQISAILDARRGWQGPAAGMFLVGLAGLLLGGVALAGMSLHRMDPPAHPKAKVVGLALLGFALILSFIAGWAVPVWALAYGVAMLVLAWSSPVSTPAWIAGAALTAASVTWFALSEMQVGTADVYGDYPVAWQTAWWIAGIGAAAGLVWWARSLPTEEPAAEAARR